MSTFVDAAPTSDGIVLCTPWRVARLSEITEAGAPALYGILQPGPNIDGGVPYVRPTEISEDKIVLEEVRRTTPEIAAKYRRSRLRTDDIILSIVGTIGKVAIVPSELDGGNITQSSVRIRLRREELLPRFLAWFLRSPLATRQYDAARLGTAVPRLNVAHVREILVPIPSLPEQREIVAEIEKQFTRLDAGVAALRRVQANLKRYRGAVLKAASEGRLVPTEAELAKTENRIFETGTELLTRILVQRSEIFQGRGKYSEPSAPDAEELQALPEGWTWATAEQLTDENRSITYGVIKLGAPVQDGVHVLRSSDVRHLRLDLEGVKRVAPEIAGGYRRTFLKGGEVLITVRGTLGGVAVAPPECRGFNISREVALLAMVEPDIAKAAAIFIGAAPLQRWLAHRAKGIAYTGINIETLKKLPVPLPPLAEQVRIVAEVERRLSATENLEALVSASLRRATRLRQSTLEAAFSRGLAGRTDTEQSGTSRP